MALLDRMLGFGIAVFVCVMFMETPVSNAALDGGADGVDNSSFANGTANTPKLTFGRLCRRDNATTEMLNVDFSVYENDPLFKVFGGPDDGQLILFEQCQFIDVTDYRNNNNRTRQYGPNCNLTRSDTMFGSGGLPNATDVDERTFITTLLINTSSNDVPCGGLKDGTNFVFILDCYRDHDFNRHFDVLIEKKCDNNTALVTLLSNSTGVRDVPVLNNTNRVNVTQRAYVFENKSNTDTNPLNEQTVEVANYISSADTATGIPLSSTIFFEWCITIDSARGDTRQYFTDLVDISGLRVDKLWASNVQSINPTIADVPTENMIAENNCGRGLGPAFELYNDTEVDIYYRTVDGVTNDWLTSPNCFRSRKIAASSFVVQDATGLAGVNITAKLSYCDTFTGDGAKCFGNLNTADKFDGYPACPTGANGRRRRQDDDDATNGVDISGLPDYMTIFLLIDTGRVADGESGGEITDEEVKAEPCFEKDTFSILTACLAFLLAVVIAMAIFLGCKVSSARRDEKESSLSGFTNKGYY